MHNQLMVPTRRIQVRRDTRFGQVGEEEGDVDAPLRVEDLELTLDVWDCYHEVEELVWAGEKT